MEVTGTVQRQAWAAGVLPPVEEVRPGLWSVPVPIPDSPLRYVLSYVLRAPGGVVVVDAGYDDDEAWSHLEAGLTQIGHGVADVRGIVVTHMHPDHYGLAPRLRRASGAWLAMHPADAELITQRSAVEVDAYVEAARTQMADSGAPAALFEGAGQYPIEFLEPGNGPDRLLVHDDVLDLGSQRLRVVHTPGHTPGHICLVDEDRDLVLTGDHVLPRISPNISILPDQLENPLGEYLGSLEAIGALDPSEVLPGHEYRFRGLPQRTRDLIHHHEERLAEVMAAVTGTPGLTTYEITLRLQWSRPIADQVGFLQRMAVNETLAHLVLLEERGNLHRSEGAPTRWFPGSVSVRGASSMVGGRSGA
ncbi:MBL fold metallo-hydrolase [Kribbia dieselivorans]|uniref:MBL fold metallo-hydrolase n=1 Tax=Kribbia dieselivorans TaxID=331526 RepID=UPI000837DBA0|nr:MBL fold metallo-hydrolase [Kribbia dieselivorans]